MKITFRGKEVEVMELADGVAKKSDTVYYVRDPLNGEWFYASSQRMAGLLKKHGSYEVIGQSTYCRESAALRRAEKQEQKAVEKAEKREQARAKLAAAKAGKETPVTTDETPEEVKDFLQIPAEQSA